MPRYKITKPYLKRKKEFECLLRRLKNKGLLYKDIAKIIQVDYQVLCYIKSGKHKFDIKKYINKINLINKYLNEYTSKKNMK